MNKIVVMGNGPSLERFDFEKDYEVDTFGMNAAYRYWRKVDWFPTFYACFDHVVLKDHSEEILELVRGRKENGIEKFFLRDSVFEHEPKLKEYDCVETYESQKHEVFSECRTIATGSSAAKCAISMGYDRISLIGVDSNYVEVIDEAKKENDNTLTIDEDVSENPNYFYDDYQQKGDRYNKPNDNRVHIKAWEELSNYIENKDIEIVNCNPDSAVRFFEFVDLGNEILSHQC